MAIKTLDGEILRNLEEQVLHNKEEIEKHWNVDRVLADFGIKVLGKFNTVDALNDPTLVDKSTLEYGDGYLIGYEVPYDVYVWTRANINAGEPDDYFLNIGKISIVGPRGPEGPAGPEGERGTRGSMWYAGESYPSSPDSYNIEDKYLNTANGVVFTVAQRPDGSNYWTTVGNIRGPQGPEGKQGKQGPEGPQGPQGVPGPQGDAGGFINIWGILTNSNQLPTPSTLDNLTVAYLVGTTKPYDLWIQVGENSSTAIWTNTGAFNAATAVSVGGVYQNVWDADTKLDKDTSTTTYNQAYVKAANGGQGTINVTKTAIGDAIPQRNSDGSITIPNIVPTFVDRAISKGVADNSYVAKQTTTSGTYVYAFDPAGQTSTKVDTWETANSIAKRDSSGNIKTNNPISNTDAVNKQYAETNFMPKPDSQSNALIGWNNSSGVQIKHYTNTIPYNGRFCTPGSENDGQEEPAGDGYYVQKDPINPYHVANKAYVDFVAPKPIAGETEDSDYRVHLTIPGNYNSAAEYFSEYGFTDPTTAIPCTITRLGDYWVGPGAVWFNIGEDIFQFTGWVMSQTTSNYSVANGTLAIDFY